MSYHATIEEVYRKAATQPQDSLCCVPQAPRFMPGLVIPKRMQQMNYGCGTTIHLQDMQPNQTVLYVGVGGGMEALQLAYFTRRPSGVIAVDSVAEMRDAARDNLQEAAQLNDWFDPSFVDIREGDARNLPVDDETVHLAAQNCLFNIFKTCEPTGNAHEPGDLEMALSEMHRTLKPGGRLVMSDPITTRPMPQHLLDDDVLRAECISGCLMYDEYIKKIVEAGFGSIEIRSRRPYRVLAREQYGLDDDLMLETIEIAAFKTDIPADGPCVFTGRYAVYTGEKESFDDGKGHVLPRGMPLGVCDKTAMALAGLQRPDIAITPSTWHYSGGGCC